jgi:hypothetical protein
MAASTARAGYEAQEAVIQLIAEISSEHAKHPDWPWGLAAKKVSSVLTKYHTYEDVNSTLFSLRVKKFLPPAFPLAQWKCWQEVQLAMLAAVGLCSVNCFGKVEHQVATGFCSPPCVFDDRKVTCGTHISIGCTVTTWSATGLPYQVRDGLGPRQWWKIIFWCYFRTASSGSCCKRACLRF